MGGTRGSRGSRGRADRSDALSPPAGKRSPFAHRHRRAEEVYVILAGTGQVKLDGEIADVRTLDAIRIAPEVVRALRPDPAVLSCSSSVRITKPTVSKSTTRGSSETQLNQVGRRTRARVREVGDRFRNHEDREVSRHRPTGDRTAPSRRIQQRRHGAAFVQSQAFLSAAAAPRRARKARVAVIPPLSTRYRRGGREHIAAGRSPATREQQPVSCCTRGVSSW
jgi:hypothetical protein